MKFLAQRRQILGQSLKKGKDGLDALLITGVPNVTYLTGFTGDSSYFVATSTNAVLVSDPRFEVQIQDECPAFGKEPGLDLHIRPHNKTTLEATIEVLTQAGATTVGVEANRLTVAELEGLRELAPKLTFVPQTNLVESQRIVKDPSEVEHIRTAIRVAERAFRMFVATVREADTEKDMVDALDGYLRRAGANGAAFPLIVAAGERGALPHAPPTRKPLAEASKLLVDWGADLLYKSDITRTIRNPYVVTPTARNKFERVGFDFERVYKTVLKAQNAAMDEIRSGARAKDVDAAARKVLAEADLEKYFTHGLGHGIGLEIHEAPRVRANSEDVLEAGMVITIEPGVYIPGWGGVRIEDDILVTRDGCTLLTTLPRDLSAPG
jgi:Xaa-Pro aminopeptidase